MKAACEPIYRHRCSGCPGR